MTRAIRNLLILTAAMSLSLIATGCSRNDGAAKLQTSPNDGVATSVATDAPPKPAGDAPSATGQPEPSQPQSPSPPRRDDAVVQVAQIKPAAEPAPQRRSAFLRVDEHATGKIPPVVFTKAHEALNVVKVGDALPALALPPVAGGAPQKLADLYGKAATVVVFWKADRRMSHELLADLGPDVVDLFGPQGVNVVGIAVGESAATARAALEKAGAKFPNLLDADGRAFAQVGSARLPRVYLVDPQGKILWFDIEYSSTTRRELHRALHALIDLKH